MHPRIAELLDYVERQRKTLDAAIDTVPRAYRNMRPSEEAWSVNDIVEHLAGVEQRITGLIAKQIAEAKANGLAKESNSSSILATIDTKRVLDRTRRIASTTLPTGTVDFDAALRQLDGARRG